MHLKAHCFTQSRIDLITDTVRVVLIFLSPSECLVTGYFMFATFHLQPDYYTSCLVWNCGVFYMQNVITWVKGKVFFVLTLLV